MLDEYDNWYYSENVLSAYFVLGAMPSSLYWLSHFILTLVIKVIITPYFTNNKNEAQDYTSAYSGRGKIRTQESICLVRNT